MPLIREKVRCLRCCWSVTVTIIVSVHFVQMTDWLEGEFLHEQVESIKVISEHITNLKRVGPGLGEYMFDKETLDH